MKKQPIPDASWTELLLWICRRRVRFSVTGDSMLPTLQAGQVVLVNLRAYTKRRPQVGDVVIATDPRKRERKIVKRVVSASEYDGYYLLGDNNDLLQSTDSRVFGAVSADHILGSVTARVKDQT